MMDNLRKDQTDAAEPDISAYFFYTFKTQSKPGAYITLNATWSLTVRSEFWIWYAEAVSLKKSGLQITWGNLSDHAQLSIQLYITFFTYALVLPKTCIQTSMCEFCEVPHQLWWCNLYAHISWPIPYITVPFIQLLVTVISNTASFCIYRALIQKLSTYLSNPLKYPDSVNPTCAQCSLLFEIPRIKPILRGTLICFSQFVSIFET